MQEHPNCHVAHLLHRKPLSFYWNRSRFFNSFRLTFNNLHAVNVEECYKIQIHVSICLKGGSRSWIISIEFEKMEFIAVKLPSDEWHKTSLMKCHINSLAAGWYGSNFNLMIFKLISGIDILSISCAIAIRWVPQDLTNDKSILVHVMAWCHQRPALLMPKGFKLEAFSRKLGCDWLMLRHQPITAKLFAKSFWLKTFQH